MDTKSGTGSIDTGTDSLCTQPASLHENEHFFQTTLDIIQTIKPLSNVEETKKNKRSISNNYSNASETKQISSTNNGGSISNFITCNTDELRKLLVCPCCHCIMKEPIYLKDCLHRMCKNCFSDICKANQNSKGKDRQQTLNCPSCFTTTTSRHILKDDFITHLCNKIDEIYPEENENIVEDFEAILEAANRQRLEAQKEMQVRMIENNEKKDTDMSKRKRGRPRIDEMQQNTLIRKKPHISESPHVIQQQIHTKKNSTVSSSVTEISKFSKNIGDSSTVIMLQRHWNTNGHPQEALQMVHVTNIGKTLVHTITSVICAQYRGYLDFKSIRLFLSQPGTAYKLAFELIWNNIDKNIIPFVVDDDNILINETTNNQIPTKKIPNHDLVDMEYPSKYLNIKRMTFLELIQNYWKPGLQLSLVWALRINTSPPLFDQQLKKHQDGEEIKNIHSTTISTYNWKTMDLDYKKLLSICKQYGFDTTNKSAWELRLLLQDYDL